MGNMNKRKDRPYMTTMVMSLAVKMYLRFTLLSLKSGGIFQESCTVYSMYL